MKNIRTSEGAVPETLVVAQGPRRGNGILFGIVATRPGGRRLGIPKFGILLGYDEAQGTAARETTMQLIEARGFTDTCFIGALQRSILGVGFDLHRGIVLIHVGPRQLLGKVLARHGAAAHKKQNQEKTPLHGHPSATSGLLKRVLLTPHLQYMDDGTIRLFGITGGKFFGKGNVP